MPTLNPKQLDRFRDRFSPAGAKDDRRDARTLGDALRRPSSHRRFKQGDFIGRQIEQVIDDPVQFSLALCDLR